MLYRASEIVGTLAPNFVPGFSPGHQITPARTKREGEK